MHAIRHFDVPGIFSRDLGKLSTFADTSYGEGKHERSKRFIRVIRPWTRDLPMAIVVPVDLFPSKDSLQKQLVLKLVEDLEKHLGRISISDVWKQQPPKAAAGESLHEYLKEVGGNTFLYENYHSTAGFRNDYLKKFGRTPFVSQFVTWRWKVGKQYTAKQHEEGMRGMKVVKKSTQITAMTLQRERISHSMPACTTNTCLVGTTSSLRGTSGGYRRF
ncbi:Amidase signature domain protein [Rutstroemia sp. NJR-2017a BBW]|nr:Amidase signature domain protein [Rutstroemia sp. NJR-2017a BBW]